MSGSGSSFFAIIDNIDYLESDIENVNLQFFQFVKKLIPVSFRISD